jgi:hypothetical protein
MIASDWATETIARTLRTDRVGVRTSGITGSVVPFPANLEAVGLIGTALSLWRGAFGRDRAVQDHHSSHL